MIGEQIGSNGSTCEPFKTVVSGSFRYIYKMPQGSTKYKRKKSLNVDIVKLVIYD